MPQGFFICPKCQEPIATSEQATHEFAHYLDENPDEAITNTVSVLGDIPPTEPTQVYDHAQMVADEEYAKKLQAEFDAEVEADQQLQGSEEEEPHPISYEHPEMQQFQPQPQPRRVVSAMRQYITTDESGQPRVHVQRYSYTGDQTDPRVDEESYPMHDIEHQNVPFMQDQREVGFPGGSFGMRDPFAGFSDMFSMMPRGLHDSNFHSVFHNIREQGGVDTVEHRGPIFIIRNRMFGPMDYETLLRLDENMYEPGHGADQEEISELPTYTFHPSQHGSEKCSVCLSDLQEGDQVMKLPCFHTYHKDCISEWLVRKAECPVCKTPISGE